MKKSITILTILFSIGFTLFAQKRNDSYLPVTKLNPDQGFITINEFHAGLGLGKTDTPYSSGFLGFTTSNGYQFNKSIVAAVGTGLTFYESGLLVPLYLDFRYRFDIGRFTPYIIADGGFLINFSELANPRLFINPGVGLRYALSSYLALNASTGLLTQYGQNRDTFVNFRTGFTYKF